MTCKKFKNTNFLIIENKFIGNSFKNAVFLYNF